LRIITEQKPNDNYIKFIKNNKIMSTYTICMVFIWIAICMLSLVVCIGSLIDGNINDMRIYFPILFISILTILSYFYYDSE